MCPKKGKGGIITETNLKFEKYYDKIQPFCEKDVKCTKAGGNYVCELTPT